MSGDTASSGSNSTAHVVPPRASLLREDLRAIVQRFAEADRRAHEAAVSEKAGEREQAEAERREAEGDFWAAGRDVAELFLFLLRFASEYHPDALRVYLVGVLRPELEALARLALEGRT